MHGRLPFKQAKNYLNNQITSNNFQLRCEIVTYINHRVQVGDVVFIIFPSGLTFATGANRTFIDEQMSGNWLIEDFVDIFNNDGSFRKMTLVRDSFFLVGEENSKKPLPQVQIIK
jgi:hypothetical protein